MKCPIDDIDLVMSDRQGIEIDYCPKCRGVWLDRGELDKIIDRSADAPENRAPVRAAPRQEERREDRPYGSRDDDRSSGKPYRKKKSLLDDIFDF